MEIRKSKIGGNPDYKWKPIPSICEREKTITKNALGIVNIFRDRRPEAVAWIEEILPTMYIGRKEEILAVFWLTPDPVWFEFDTGSKVLSICWLEKKVGS